MDALGHPRAALLVGGTSELGHAILRALTDGRGCRVVLAGRDRDRTLASADELPGEVGYVHFDAEDPSSYASCVREAWTAGDVDLVIVAHGILGDNDRAWVDIEEANAIATIDYASATAVLAGVADRIVRQGHGTVVVLSSVAGVRVRRDNFVYGAAKAGLDAFATGLADALRPHGGRVVVVRPGFVHTRMTEGMAAPPLATTPEDVGREVAAAIRAGRDVVWVPGSLRWVMAALRLLPRPAFNRLAGRARAVGPRPGRGDACGEGSSRSGVSATRRGRLGS